VPPISNYPNDLDQGFKTASYMIADDAVPLLEEMGYIVPQSNYTELAQKRQNYQHEFSISDIYVRFVLSCRERRITYLSSKQFIEQALKPKILEQKPYSRRSGSLPSSR
jgi:hypothetical protein